MMPAPPTPARSLCRYPALPYDWRCLSPGGLLSPTSLKGRGPNGQRAAGAAPRHPRHPTARPSLRPALVDLSLPPLYPLRVCHDRPPEVTAGARRQLLAVLTFHVPRIGPAVGPTALPKCRAP